MKGLWPMDRAVDGGEGQPGPKLGPGGSCGVHSWIEGASSDGRRVSWFASDLLRGFARSFEAFCVGLAFQ